nr:hybrid signal transduction histidine kinase M [Tanacetum cinerariifolium]
MGKQSFTTDAKGWTWIFRNNKNPNLKSIENPYQKDMERIATSFYVLNFPETLDGNGLWNACATYGRIVDAFIANKRSKRGKRFGFIRFLGIKDAHDFVRSLSNIWVDSFHLYVSVAHFQGGNASASQPTNRIPVKDDNTKPNLNPNSSYQEAPSTKATFAAVIHNKPKPTETTHSPVTKQTITLNDNDFITIKDSSTNDLNDKLNELAQATKDKKIHFECPNATDLDQPCEQVEEEVIKVSDTSDLSRPPGFEHVKRSSSSTSKCSIIFARHQKKDIKADYFSSFIDSFGLIDLPIGGRYYTWMNKVEKGYQVAQFLPLVTLDKIAKVFEEGENGPTVEQSTPPEGFGASGTHVETDTASTNREGCQLDDLIKMWILGSLCDSLQEQVVTTPGNAKALWDYLKDIFHDKKYARAINLDNEIRSFKINKMSVNEYCTKIKSMTSWLKNLDCEVSEKNLVIYAVNESSFTNETDASTMLESSSSSPTILLASSSSDAKGNNPSKPLNNLQLCNHFSRGTCKFGDQFKPNDWPNRYTHHPLVAPVYYTATGPGPMAQLVPHQQPQPTSSAHQPVVYMAHQNSQGIPGQPNYNGHVILGPAPAVYASQPTALPSAFSTMTLQDLTWNIDTALLQQIIDSLHKEFDLTDLGAFNYFLGIFATSHSTGLFLSQKQYALQHFERTHMVACNPSWTPVDTEAKLVLTVSVDLSSYARPERATFSCPQTYLMSCSGPLDFGLHLYASATSYLVVTDTLVYCDNVNVVYMSANPVQHQRTKHIEIDIHFVRDKVTVGDVHVFHVPSRFQYADIFIKGLPPALFEEFRSRLSVHPSPAQTVKAY